MTHRSQRLFGFAALALAVFALPGRGDVVILKDGYTIHGKVGVEQTAIFDPLTGASIVTRKMNGLNVVDDGPRWTVFSATYQRVGEVDKFNRFADLIQLTRPIFRKSQYPILNQMHFEKKTEFNDRWQRTLYYSNPAGGVHQIEQQIDVLTPHYARINSFSHVWTSYYLTKELGPNLVRKLLATHPEFVEKGKPDAGKRAKLIRFLMQADWLADAEDEVDRLEKDCPDETKRVEELRAAVREKKVESLLAEVELAKEGGRHAFAQQALKQVPKDKVPAKTALRVAALKAEYEAGAAKLARAKRFLEELPKELKVPSFKDLAEAAAVIAEELDLDTVARLDLFGTLSEQAETAKEAGKPVLHKPEQLLSAAVTGWLLGNNSTETNVPAARKCLKAREMALSYLRTANPGKRRDVLSGYEQEADALSFDELEKLISVLPPPEADKEITTGPVLKTTGPVPGYTTGVKYLLQLPPEYRHGRPYPLLLVLPNGNERMADTLKRFGDLPGRHGYILAAVDWNENGQRGAYGYTEEEQATATGVLRHLRRTLQVDSDRVFLFGYGEGANMALDLGATRPDQFAGVIPMAATPDAQLFQVFEYWKNFQNLPVYMIVGDHAGDSVKTIRSILTAWMPRGYPAVAVSYKGRGFEWFGEELPFIFDWMGRKTRATATPELGRPSEEFRTIRQSSSRFYWVSTDEIDPKNLFDPQRPQRSFYPARVRAKFSEGNQITVTQLGLRQVSLWLARGTVDFSKPVYVTIKDHPSGTWKKDLAPKVSVLLEDLYERGDRQHPFVQRIDCADLPKVVKFSAQ
jgi:pimeloyl-ACP methyl ester carboxylesterase